MMKTWKRFRILLFSIICMLVVHFPVKGATFDEINQSGIFVKQQTNYTCTLASAVMLVRRAALGTGNANWKSITESSMRGTAWLEGTGLYNSFTYAGISVGSGSISGTSQIKSLLNSHPEGIVIYTNKHAVLATDYTDGVIYCADPANGTPYGRIPISSSSITAESCKKYWYVKSPNVILSGISFDTYSIESVEENNIKASVWLNNSQGKTISEIGIQCGTNKDSAQERAIVTESVNWTRPNLAYNANSYFGSLASNKLYYIRYYVIVEGTKYYSDWMEATTKKSVVSFDTYSIENLYESDARLSVWIDNPEGRKLSVIGIEYGKSREYVDRKAINTDVSWTRSNSSYYLSGFYGHYLESNTQYFARYYC